jgi:hypothetical protein
MSKTLTMSGQTFYVHDPNEYLIGREKHNSYQTSPDTSLEQGYAVSSRYIFNLYFGTDNGNATTENNEYTGSIVDMYTAMLKAGSRHRFVPAAIPSKAAEVNAAAVSVSNVLNVPSASLDSEPGSRLDLDMLAGGAIFNSSVSAAQLANFFKDPDAEMRNFQRASASIVDQSTLTVEKASLEAFYATYLAALDTLNQATASHTTVSEAQEVAQAAYDASVAEQTTAQAAYDVAVAARVAAEANENTDPATLVAAQTAEADALVEKDAADAAEDAALAALTAANDALTAEDAELQGAEMARDMAHLDWTTQTTVVTDAETALGTKETALVNTVYDPNTIAWQDASFRMHNGDSVVMVVKLSPTDGITGGDIRYVAHEFKIVGPAADDPFQLV